MKHLLSLFELNRQEIEDILNLATDLKQQHDRGERPQLLRGRVLTQIFEKPSLRTRISFEAAMMQLGGGSIFLSMQDAGLNGRESRADVARVLSSYCDAVVLRTFSHELIEDFARSSRCAVINGLSDDLHPCQALTDLMTVREVFGSLDGRRIVYVGDGNNVAASLAIGTAHLEVPFTICTPPDYALKDDFLVDLKRRIPTADVTQTTDLSEAVQSADIIYTDVWASMGQEAESDLRNKVFAPYQINAEVMAMAPRHCRFMHCLPARRGTEVTDDVMDGPQCVAFVQAENRMHLAKGLLVWLIEQNQTAS